MLHPKLERLKNAIMMGGELQKQQDELHKAYKDMSHDDLITKVLQLESDLKEKDKELKEKNKKTRKKEYDDEGNELIIQRNKKSIETYDGENFHKFMKTADWQSMNNPEDTENYIDPKYYAYDPDDYKSTYDKFKKKYFDYQQKFIQNWSLSTSEVVILYYGIGSGKTFIAVSCAHEYTILNEHSYVYFVIPASLVLNTISECYKRHIDPTRKDNKGHYIYNFVSYQQLLNSHFDFKDNSLLILDEAHNLRNFKSEEISEKVSARKTVKTGNYSLVGNKLAERLLNTSSKFLRTIFMTGTLLVNSPKDVEALMAIGFKKQPLLDIDKSQYDNIINSDKEFDIYYGGLIAYKQLSEKDKSFTNYPKKHYKFVDIPSDDIELYTGTDMKLDSYFIKTRNQGIKNKIKWIINFLKKPENKNKKTLIYSQFLTNKIKPLIGVLKSLGLKVDMISGEDTQNNKMDIVKKYNSGEITVLIFSLAIKEGISFEETNNFITIEPYWNYAILEQVLGRAVRAKSHSLGDKSTVYFYFLVATNSNITITQWFYDANKIMNNNIKKLLYKKDDKGIKIRNEFANDKGSRDIDLYNRMFNKQESINEFEVKLLKPEISFENWHTVENSDFVKLYELSKLEEIAKNGGRPLTNKEEIRLKRKLYNTEYEKKILETNSKITRFATDIKYRENRNPDLDQKMDDKGYANKMDEIKGWVKNGDTLQQIFVKLGIDKTEITQFQANFTPITEIKILINNSGIIEDTRENLKILEPTAGVGGVIGELLKTNNKSNYMIDCNEFHSAFYAIGKALFDDIDNVKWWNTDFWIYQSKYNYDYILGNPPFNLMTQVLVETKFIREKGKPPPDPPSKFEKVDKRLYDIHFVSKAYNMLATDGILSMIISDRFDRDNTIPVFKVFREYMKYLKDQGNTENDEEKYYKLIRDVGSFKADEGVVKSQETNFPMINIVLRKLENFNINLDDPKAIEKRITQNMDNEDNAALLLQDVKKVEKKLMKDNKIVRTLPDGSKPKRTRKTTKKTTKTTTEEIKEPSIDVINTWDIPQKQKDSYIQEAKKQEEIKKKVEKIEDDYDVDYGNSFEDEYKPTPKEIQESKKQTERNDEVMKRRLQLLRGEEIKPVKNTWDIKPKRTINRKI